MFFGSFEYDRTWVEKKYNGDDDNDIDINDDGGEAPNDNDYHEPQPKILTSQLVILPCLESLWHHNLTLFKGLTIWD
jgi:hypothetical protein